MKNFLKLIALAVCLRAFPQATPGTYPYTKPYPTNGSTPGSTLRIFTGSGSTSGYTDNYPVVWDVFVGGGYRSVGTTTERDQILSGRRKEGMLVYVATTGLTYRLGSDLTTWTSLVSETAALYQPLDTDLTTIAALTPTTDSFMQAKAGAWAARTIDQVKADLLLTGTNTGDQVLVQSAIQLNTARTINGTAFDGTANITLGANSVTLGQLATAAPYTLIGNGTGSTATPQALDTNAVVAMLSAAVLGANTFTGTQTFVHTAGGGTAPSVAANVGAGTSPTVTLATAHDHAFTLNVTTGTSPVAATNVATVTFGLAFASAPNSVWSPANAATAALYGSTNAYFLTSTTNVVLWANTNALAASTAYSWRVINVQ